MSCGKNRLSLNTPPRGPKDWQKFKILLRDWNFQATNLRLKFLIEIENFKRTTQQGPCLWGIIKVGIEIFNRDWNFQLRLKISSLDWKFQAYGWKISRDQSGLIFSIAGPSGSQSCDLQACYRAQKESQNPENTKQLKKHKLLHCRFTKMTLLAYFSAFFSDFPGSIGGGDSYFHCIFSYLFGIPGFSYSVARLQDRNPRVSLAHRRRALMPLSK